MFEFFVISQPYFCCQILESTIECSGVEMDDLRQGAKDALGYVVTHLAVVEGFRRASKVDAVSVPAGSVCHDSNEAAWVIGPECLGKLVSDYTEVVRRERGGPGVMRAERG